MKHLILAASLTPIAAPAFADRVRDAAGTASQQQSAMTTDTQQKHSYSYSSDDGTGSAIEARNARRHRSAMKRSSNAKAVWRGSVHYY